jgi:flagellar basal body-associated protein FliL
MALPLKQRRRQQILLIVALVILLVTGGVLYFGFFKKPKLPSQEAIPAEALPGPATEQTSSLLDEKLRRINKLDFEFLNEKILSFLKVHGNLPVQKGATGRENPFIPY